MGEDLGEDVDDRQPPRFLSRRTWRLGSMLVAVGAGALFITTGLNAHGLDLRAASVTDLASVVRQEKQRTVDLQAEVAQLNRTVGRLSKRVDDPRVSRLQDRVAALKAPAGLVAETGPGMTVVLDDAPESEVEKLADSPGPITADMLVVHQQDIQAVANALWRGGAEAMTINGQRIIATTGIKCVGNTVILHGVQYSPPYRISAIGSISGMEESLAGDPYIAAYQTFVDKVHLGYEQRVEAELHMRAYQGSLELRHAQPLTGPTDG